MTKRTDWHLRQLTVHFFELYRVLYSPKGSDLDTQERARLEHVLKNQLPELLEKNLQKLRYCMAATGDLKSHEPRLIKLNFNPQGGLRK